MRAKTKLLGAVAAGALLLASVGTVVPAGAQGSVRGVTGSEIKVSGLGYTALYESAGQAAKIRFDMANSDGELPGGRKINYIGFADDKSSTDINVQEGRRLVDQEGIFAAVPINTVTFAASEYFNQMKVPAVGWGTSAPFCSVDGKPIYMFGFSGCLVNTQTEYLAQTWPGLAAAQLEAQGVKSPKGQTAALIGENTDSGKRAQVVVGDPIKDVGFDLVYNETPVPAAPAVVTDWTPFVQAIMTADNGQPPDVVFIVLTTNNVLGLGRALNQAGYKGIQTNAVAYDPRLTSLANGWSVFTQFATPEAPAMADIKAALNAGGMTAIGQPALSGWFAADMFVEILKKVGKNVTPERFLKVASKFTYEVEGVIGPTTYPVGYQYGTPCGQMAVGNGTAWTVGAEFQCFPVLKQGKNGKVTEVPYESLKLQKG